MLNSKLSLELQKPLLISIEKDDGSYVGVINLNHIAGIFAVNTPQVQSGVSILFKNDDDPVNISNCLNFLKHLRKTIPIQEPQEVPPPNTEQK